MKNFPLVSVVIATKNEEKNIADCLVSIKQQSYLQKSIEIIVVDNSSTDKTTQIARKYTVKIFNQGPERSLQRNFGLLRKATGKYLVFLDADMRLSPKVIAKAVNLLEKSTLVGLYLPEKISGRFFWNKVRNFERSFYDGTVIDCVRVIKAPVFRKSGGFDPELTGPEDWDLDKKIRKLGETAVLKEAVIYHDEGKFNLKKYLKKKSYYSQSFNKYIKKWGKNDPDIKKQFGLFYRFCGVFIENKKWRKLVLHPFLTLGIIYLRIFVGLMYLSRKYNFDDK